jgi:hypothetical protein
VPKSRYQTNSKPELSPRPTDELKLNPKPSTETGQLQSRRIITKRVDRIQKQAGDPA